MMLEPKTQLREALTQIVQLAAAVIAQETPEQAARLILERAAAWLEAESGCVGHIPADASHTRLVAVIGSPPPRIDDQPCPAPSPFFSEQLLSAPALMHQTLSGWIALANGKRPFTPADLDLLTGLATLYAAALKRLEIQAELSNTRREADAANQKRNELLSNMSHEVRTPMNGILGMLELAIQLEKNPRQLENLYLARDSAEALLNLLNNLFNFSEIEVGALKIKQIRFSLRSVVESVLSSLRSRAEGKGIGLHCHFSNDAPNWIMGDPERLRQVLVNILGNAVKFTETGAVTLTLETVAPDPAADASDTTLKFIIQDTGFGIPPQRLKTLFSSPGLVDKAIGRSYGGIGLGLATSRQIVAMMGGEISAATQVGVGSTFSFTARFDIPPQIASPPKRIANFQPAPGTRPKRQIFDLDGALNNFSRDKLQLQQAARRFLEHTPGFLQQLQSAVAAENYTLSEGVAGDLNKNAARLGALKLAGEAFRLQMAVRSAELSKINVVLQNLINEFNVFQKNMAEFQWEPINERENNENLDRGR